MKLLLNKKVSRGILSSAVLAGMLAVLAPVQAQVGERKPSTADLYEAGRQAFFRKDFKAAKPYFVKVLKVKPDHVPSRSMLNTILQAEKKAGAADSMRGWAMRTIIPTINVEDAPIEEVLAFLRVKSRAITGGQWEPNFVLRKGQGEAAGDGGSAGKMTMALRKVPVEYVIRTMAEMSGLAVRYEEHAITIAPKELLPPEQGVLGKAQSVAVDRREKS
ncbi:MAG: hypothetical protein ACI9R3_000344 [Verrucomicrobiales bacterium]|jgi:hypothetical protein